MIFIDCQDSTCNFFVQAHTVEALYSETPETDGCDSEEYDFDRLDHRITLYLMMNKFDNNEEFRFKVKVCCFIISSST